MLTEEDVIKLFTYHPPKEDQVERYNKLRESAKAFALAIYECCPEGPLGGPDRTAAIRKVREAVMAAYSSIAVGEAE